MAKTKVIQNSYVSGIMNDKAFGRTDIGRFYNSVAEANNMLLATTGGMFKRPGFQFVDVTDVPVAQSELQGAVRIVDFVFNINQKYLFLMYAGQIDVYHVPDRSKGESAGLGVPFGSVSAPELTAKIISEMNIIQRGDITILFHTDMKTRAITRNGYEDFNIGVLDMIIPLEDITDPNTEMWSNSLGWPSYGAFFQGRLVCAGSKTYPLTVWCSKAQDYFDFQIAVAQANEPGSPITDTLDSDKVNKITGIYAGRNLQLFTSGAEFVNIAQLLTPEASAWLIQTRYGSNDGVPLNSLDGSTFFVDRFSAVREFIFDYSQDAHVSNDLTTLAAHLFNSPFRLETIKSAKTSLGRYTYLLNTDGTMAVLNFNKSEGIVAWVRVESTHGKIIDISTVDNELYLLIATQDKIVLERLDITADVTYLDNYTYVRGTLPHRTCGNISTSCEDTIGGIDGTNFILNNIWCEDCNMFSSPDVPQLTEIDGLDRFDDEEVSLVLDNIYQGEVLVTDGKIPIDKNFTIAKIGLKYNANVKSLPISSPQFPMELAEKRIIKIKLYMYNSSGFYLDNEFIPSLTFDVSNYDEAPALVTGVYEHWTLGWTTLGDFNIHSDSPLGFNVLKADVTIDVTE